jgi:hypothetical protein
MEATKSLRAIALTILVATLVAGTVDMAEVCVYWAITKDVAPERIFQSVASGLLGKAAFQGGEQTAALGLALHFGIMAVMATVYVLASLRLPILTRKPVLMGIGYGLATYVVMNYGVLPLSQARHGGPFVLPVFLNAVFAHVAMVGLPIALIAARRERKLAQAVVA